MRIRTFQGLVPAAGREFDRDALDEHVMSEIARFKRPKTYVKLDELPKNNYGKVLKTALRERLNAEAEGG